MGWTVDHPFFDQLGPDRPKAVDLDPKNCGNITGSIGVWTQMGHGSQIILLAGGKSIKPDAEEVGIKPGNNLGGNAVDML